MAKNLAYTTWADIQNEIMDQYGNPQKAVRVGMLLMSAVQITTDWEDPAYLTNTLIALDRVKAEVRETQRKLKDLNRNKSPL